MQTAQKQAELTKTQSIVLLRNLMRLSYGFVRAQCPASRLLAVNADTCACVARFIQARPLHSPLLPTRRLHPRPDQRLRLVSNPQPNRSSASTR